MYKLANCLSILKNNHLISYVERKSITHVEHRPNFVNYYYQLYTSILNSLYFYHKDL